MNCDFYITLISGHLDGVNTKAEEEQLQKHLNGCKQCRELLALMQANDVLLKSTKAQAPADLTQRIMKQVRKTPKKQSKKPFYISLVTSGLAVAAVLALVFMGEVETPSLETSQDARATVAATVENELKAPLRRVDGTFAPEETLEGSMLDEPLLTGETYSYYGSMTKEPEVIAKDAMSTDMAVLVIAADRASVTFCGERIALKELTAILQDGEYGLTGSETAAYIVTWEELQQVVLSYEGIFAMEKYYSEDADYVNAIILFVE